MELRVLRYFLAVAREGNITKAAAALNVTQPTLSRQLADLEYELGVKLFERGGRGITLTEEGLLLRKRAGEMMDLAAKTESELHSGSGVSGEIYVGGGETDAMSIVAKAARELRADHPGVRFHLFSGNAPDVTERLDKGLLDFGILIEPADLSGYDFIRLPAVDSWGVLALPESHVASLSAARPEDIKDAPLVVSRQELSAGALEAWFGTGFENLNVAATYNLIYNASLMVKEGIGYALTLDKLLDAEARGLRFVPLDPPVEARINMVWKKYQTFTKAARLFMEKVRLASIL